MTRDPLPAIGSHRFRVAPPTSWALPAIIEDTRERTPLPFAALDERDRLPVIRAALEVGDYTADGMEADLFIERKSIPDLVASVTRERRRFEDELAFAAALPFRWRFWVIVGTNPACSCARQLELGDWRSMATAASVRASVDAFAAKYGLQVRFCDSPLDAAATVARTVRYCARHLANARWTQRGFHARNEARRAAKEDRAARRPADAPICAPAASEPAQAAIMPPDAANAPARNSGAFPATAQNGALLAQNGASL